MLVYLVLFIFLFVFAVLSVYSTEKTKDFFAYFGAVIVVLFQAFRWENGTDWDTYYAMFSDYGNSSPDSLYEIGWFHLNKFFYTTTESYTVFLLFQSSFIFFCGLKFARLMGIDNRSMIVLSTISFAIFPVRINLALGLVSLSYIYIIERDLFRFLLLILIASSIHISSIVFIPFYYIYQKQLSLSTITVIYFAFCGIGIASSFVLSNFQSVLNIINLYASDGFQDKLDGYVSDGGSVDYLNWTPIYYFFAFCRGFLFLYIYVQIRDCFFNNSVPYNILLNLYLSGICLVRIFSSAIPYFARIGNFATLGGDIMLLLGISRLDRNKQLVCISLYGLYLLYTYISTLNGQYGDLYIPYNFVL